MNNTHFFFQAISAKLNSYLDFQNFFEYKYYKKLIIINLPRNYYSFINTTNVNFFISNINNTSLLNIRTKTDKNALQV